MVQTNSSKEKLLLFPFAVLSRAMQLGLMASLFANAEVFAFCWRKEPCSKNKRPVPFNSHVNRYCANDSVRTEV